MTTDELLLPASPGIDGTLYIGGSWLPGSGGQAIEVTNPSDGSVVGRVGDGTPDDARAAVDAADRAAPGWAARAPRERAEILRRCFELMTRDHERLARLIALENGKALADARGEVTYAAEFFRWYAEEAVRLKGELTRAPSGGNWILVDHKPIGISVLVTPWNFPAAMATRKLAPALAAGCTTILKPAALTPLTAFAIAELMSEAGVPAGVVNVVTTRDAGGVVGTMVGDPRVRKLSFTGSTEVGRSLLHMAADTVVSCSMELGGNAPFIVLEDADLDDAIDGIMVAKMRNGGQACTAANRVYIASSLHDAFADRLAGVMGALTVGAGTDEATQCGPMINDAAVSRIQDLVDEASRGGARVVTGGMAPIGPGSFYPPTVLAGVTGDARLLEEEIFGPVAVLIPFDDENEMVRRANDTVHGLAAYVYTGDLARGLALARRLEAGMVGVNRGLVSDPAAPFGGVKQSGLGREGSDHGLLEFVEPQYVAVDW